MEGAYRQTNRTAQELCDWRNGCVRDSAAAETRYLRTYRQLPLPYPIMEGLPVTGQLKDSLLRPHAREGLLSFKLRPY